MSYTDAEMLMATQVAYLDFKGDNTNVNVGDVVDRILKAYGEYDSTTGSYTIKNGVTGAAKAQFETAQNIINLSEQNNVVSWRHWTIVDSCNKQDTSGYYGCLIDTGEGNAIVGCRGSESYDGDQVKKDWICADFGRVNNELTRQQADATEYMNYLYKKFGDRYDSFSFTGHSLGGSLATHAAISAPEGMQDKIDKVISYDGPGFSDEYLKKYAEQIKRIKKKLNHYEYSLIGSLLNQPEGIYNKVIKAHDDRVKDDIFETQLYRHHTRNVEFDENGNVIGGEQGILQKILGPVSRIFENLPILLQSSLFLGFLAQIFSAYRLSIDDQIKQDLDKAVQDVAEKANELYDAYLSFVVSGDYEIHTGEACSLTDALQSTQQRLNRIADQVNEIKRDLPYDSVSAYYYKHCLGTASNAIAADGKKAKKILNVIDQAVTKYNRGDQEVSALF